MTTQEMMKSAGKDVTLKTRLLMFALGAVGLFFPGLAMVAMMKGVAKAVEDCPEFLEELRNAD
jgi:hypothetical protein